MEILVHVQNHYGYLDSFWTAFGSKVGCIKEKIIPYLICRYILKKDWTHNQSTKKSQVHKKLTSHPDTGLRRGWDAKENHVNKVFFLRDRMAAVFSFSNL